MAHEHLDTPGSTMTEREFFRFRELIHKHTGIWLRDGKEVMLSSRLSRQMRSHGLHAFAQYAAFLEKLPQHDEHLREFINAVTTNKTSFFRESHHFDFLGSTLVPAMKRAAEKGASRTLRIWSAACSTGEEPYSIAISLLEAFRGAQSGWQIQIVASDIDTTVLQTAQAGIYLETAMQDVAEPLQHRYFLRGKGEMSGCVKVKPEVAELVSFKRINLMDSAWPVEDRFDAIFFRNALIYFQPDIQNRFLRKMLRHLKPEAYLLLGHSEHVPWLYDAVMPLHQTIYRKRPETRSTTLAKKDVAARPCHAAA